MKVFFDTNLFIYLWEEGHAERTKRMEGILEKVQKTDGKLVTSTLTLGEILVHPMRHGATEAISAYVETFERLDLIPFDGTCSVFFAEIRAIIQRLSRLMQFKWHVPGVLHATGFLRMIADFLL